MTMAVVLVLLLNLQTALCQDNSPASQFVLLDSLPKEFGSVEHPGNHKMIVRTNFKVMGDIMSVAIGHIRTI